MRILLLTLLTATLPPTLQAAGQIAEQEKASLTAPVKQQQDNRFKGTLFDALRNLSGMLPKQNGSKGSSGQHAATIGIRGNESTASLMNPYWKEDQGEDPAFQAQLHEYSQGQALLEEGKLKEAEQAISGFIQRHHDSKLLPNARFALSLAYIGQGQKQKGRETMERFAADYPQHPLTADAQKLLPELK